MLHNPLIFIHGAGDRARVWREQLEYFGERATAIDLPGHGSRPDNLPERVEVRDYALAVQAIIDDELHLKQPIIAGHSLGGLIALELGLTAGSELGGLILLGTGARMRVLPAFLETARTQPEQALLNLKQMSTLQANSPEAIASALPNPEVATLYRDLLACNTFDVMERLHELHLPTLILCGAEERNAPVKYSEYLHTHIVGSTLKIIPHAAHYVQREQAEEVNKAIEHWLKSN